MKVYIVRHGQVPHNALKQYNTAIASTRKMRLQ